MFKADQVTVPVPLPMSEFPAAAATLLGYVRSGPTTLDTDILDDLGTSGSALTAATGFTGPLSAGNFAFWIQQTGVEASYAFDFVLTPVPEPEQWRSCSAVDCCSLGTCTGSVQRRKVDSARGVTGPLGQPLWVRRFRFGKVVAYLARNSLSRSNAVFAVQRCRKLPVVGDG